MLAFLKKNILILAAMIALLIGVAVYLNSKKGESADPTREVTQDGGVVSEDSDIIKKLTLLSTLSIKRDIFDNTAYKRLQPIRTDVPTLIYRNQNPFAPIGQRQDRFSTTTQSRPSSGSPTNR